MATGLPSHKRIKNWMKPVFTVDERWCLFVNNMRSPPWFDKDAQHEPQPKAGLHPLEVMVSTCGTLCGSSTLKEPRGSQFWFNLMLKSEPGRRKSKKTPEFRKFRKSEFCPFLHWTH
ncbi:hypothetical protein Y032_0006g3130 [Ancylostoma ceylanicum]|nr:hypothetical protein Y032_0006g3130 [Ancylostoma ceylanicum]